VVANRAENNIQRSAVELEQGVKIVHRERVDFYAGGMEQIRLEGILEKPDGVESSPACILCHPHPMGGGSMYVPLLETVAQVLVENGWACLRFNFRGVGRSGGESSGGRLEIEDIDGAFMMLREREDICTDVVALAGWSFGSWVGLRWAVKEKACRRVALISPPMVGFDFFQFLDSSEIAIPGDSLIVCGSRDQFSDAEKLGRLADKLGAELRLVEGADHFLFGHESEIAGIIASHWNTTQAP
jgi:alpha/beta superfamily hydrolase